MPPGKKYGGRDFVKGNKANPLGGGAHNADLRTVRKLTHTQIAEVGTLLLEGDVDELQEMVNNRKNSVLKTLLASIIVKAIKGGDYSALNALLDRIIGKVKDKVELSGPDDGPIQVSQLTKAERIAAIKALDKKLKLTADEE